MAGRFKELLKKYGKVALGVHFSVSAASVTGLYVAIKSNVDVESMLEKVGLPNLLKKGEKKPDVNNPQTAVDASTLDNFSGIEEQTQVGQDQAAQEGGGGGVVVKQRNRTTDLVASTGGALTLAFLLNKALFPVRVPITLALTPPVARFLARRQIFKNSL